MHSDVTLLLMESRTSRCLAVLVLVLASLTASNAQAHAATSVLLEDAAEYRFDFGTETSPVAAGLIPITPASTGDVSWSGSVGADDRGGDALRGDYVASSQDRTLSIRLPHNGIWIATVLIGDTYARDEIAIRMEGLRMRADNIAVGAGDVVEVSEGVLVEDGVLDIALEDQGGNDPYWLLNGLVLRSSTANVDLSQTNYQYDFGPEWAVPANGMERVSPATTGDISWASAIDREQQGDSANVANSTTVGGAKSGTLRHKIANGLWKVTLSIGSPDPRPHTTTVLAEGHVLFDSITTAAQEIVTVDGAVLVSDGELTLTFTDPESTSSGWEVTQLALDRLSLDEGQYCPTPRAPDTRGTLLLSGENDARYGTASVLRYEDDGVAIGRRNYIVENGHTWTIARGGERYGWRVYENNFSEITEQEARRGTHSLAVETLPTTTELQGSRKQRLEYTFDHRSQWHGEQDLGSYAFSFKLDEQKWDNPQDWFVLSQFLQESSNPAVPFHQMIMLDLKTVGGETSLSVRLNHGTRDGGLPELGNYRINTLQTETLDPGKWYDIVVDWKVDTSGILVNDLSASTGSGYARIHIKEANQNDYRVYAMEDVPIGFKDSGKTVELTVGIYKAATQTSHRIYFDEVRSGDSPESVMIDDTLPAPQPECELRLGGTLWQDEDNDEIADAAESGSRFSNVEVHLYDASSDTLVATSTTTAAGDYLFERMHGGAYVVRIPNTATNAQILNVHTSSTGDDGDDADRRADDDIDGDDNGFTDPASNYLFSSSPITMAQYLEPTGEASHTDNSAAEAAADASDGGTLPYADDNSNLAVDFGFVPLQAGDVNCDHHVDAADALIILQHKVGIRADGGSCPAAAADMTLHLNVGDVNADTTVDVADALLIVGCGVQIDEAFCQ